MNIAVLLLSYLHEIMPAKTLPQVGEVLSRSLPLLRSFDMLQEEESIFYENVFAGRFPMLQPGTSYPALMGQH